MNLNFYANIMEEALIPNKQESKGFLIGRIMQKVYADIKKYLGADELQKAKQKIELLNQKETLVKQQLTDFKRETINKNGIIPKKMLKIKKLRNSNAELSEIQKENTELDKMWKLYFVQKKNLFTDYCFAKLNKLYFFIKVLEDVYNIKNKNKDYEIDIDIEDAILEGFYEPIAGIFYTAAGVNPKEIPSKKGMPNWGMYSNEEIQKYIKNDNIVGLFQKYADDIMAMMETTNKEIDLILEQIKKLEKVEKSDSENSVKVAEKNRNDLSRRIRELGQKTVDNEEKFQDIFESINSFDFLLNSTPENQEYDNILEGVGQQDIIDIINDRISKNKNKNIKFTVINNESSIGIKTESLLANTEYDDTFLVIKKGFVQFSKVGFKYEVKEVKSSENLIDMIELFINSPDVFQKEEKYILKAISENVGTVKTMNNQQHSFFKTKEEVEKWLKEMGIRYYEITKTLIVHCKGSNIDLSNKGLKFIPVQFGQVMRADFSNNELTSLKGCPKKVDYSFNCSNNKLSSFEYFPEIEKGGLNISHNNFKSLKGLPYKKLYDLFDCSYNELTNLDGCIEFLNYSLSDGDGYNDFNCSHNEITSMEGCPKGIIHLDCSFNKLTSFDGCPDKLHSNDGTSNSFKGNNNPIKTLRGYPKYYSMFYDILTNFEGMSFKDIAKRVNPDESDNDRFFRSWKYYNHNIEFLLNYIRVLNGDASEEQIAAIIEYCDSKEDNEHYDYIKKAKTMIMNDLEKLQLI